MPIIVHLLSTTPPEFITTTKQVDWESPERPVVRSEISRVDGCPVLTRLNGFLVQQGVPATLQYIFRKSNGNPEDLSEYFASGNSLSESASASVNSAGGRLLLHVKECISSGHGARNPIWEIEGDAISPEEGVFEATLLPEIVAHAGIYEMSWGIVAPDGILVRINPSLLSVERSLFSSDTDAIFRGLGPPTISEIRLSIKDSSPAENLLLSDIEFASEEIMDAIKRPVQYWNEVPPPIKTFTTKTFPYREHWRKAIAGYLFLMAADSYRRNHLNYQAGGLSVADKDKERNYTEAGERLIAEYQSWVLNAKVAINLRSVYANVGSSYSSHYRRGY